MLRKTLSAVAAVAAVAAMGVGTAGVANASPVLKTVVVPCVTPNVPVGCGWHGGNGGHDGHRGGFLGGLGHGLGFNRGGLLGTGILGGGNYGRFGGTYWQRGGVIMPYSQVLSTCGCSAGIDPVSEGYTLVQDPQQVIVVPSGPVVTGDGSCSLTSVNWGLGGFQRGARFFGLHHR